LSAFEVCGTSYDGNREPRIFMCIGLVIVISFIISDSMLIFSTSWHY